MCIILWILWQWLTSSFKQWSENDMILDADEKKIATPIMPRWIADTWKPIFFNIEYYKAYYF